MELKMEKRQTKRALAVSAISFREDNRSTDRKKRDEEGLREKSQTMNFH